MMPRIFRFPAHAADAAARLAAAAGAEAATAAAVVSKGKGVSSLVAADLVLKLHCRSPSLSSSSPAAAYLSLARQHAPRQQFSSATFSARQKQQQQQQQPLPSLRSAAAAFASTPAAADRRVSGETAAAAALATGAAATTTGRGEFEEAAATAAAVLCPSSAAAAAAVPPGVANAPLHRSARGEGAAAAASPAANSLASSSAANTATVSPSAAATASPFSSSSSSEAAASPSAATASHLAVASPSCAATAAEKASSSSAAAPAVSAGVKASETGALEAIPLRDPLVNASFSSKKIPKNYVKETLIPHLESQIVVMAKGLDEQQLTSLAAAYAKLPPELRHYELEKELCSRILFRVDGYNAQQIVQVLWPAYVLLQRHELAQQLPLWRAFAERIEKEFILRELSALNLISIIRVYQKIQDRLLAEKTLPLLRGKAAVSSSRRHHGASSSSRQERTSSSSSSLGGEAPTAGDTAALAAAKEEEGRGAVAARGGEGGRPSHAAAAAGTTAEREAAETGEREVDEEEGEFGGFLRMLEELLRKGLTAFDATELHDVVVSLSQHHRETRRDVQLLQLLLPLVEQRAGQLSLLHLLSLLRALVKMKVLHAGLFDQAAAELQNTQKVKKMPAKYVAQVVWLFARVGRLFDVACTMVPLMEQHITNFSPVDFARLAQALPLQSTIPLRICQNLQPRISSFNVDDFCFFFAACVRLCLLPDASGSIPRLQRLTEAAEEEMSGAAAALVLAVDGKELLQSLLSYMQQQEDAFKREHIRRIVLVIEGYKEDYGYLLEEIPAEWKDIGDSLDVMKDKADIRSTVPAAPSP